MSLNIYHQQQKHNGLKCSCVFYVRVDTIILHCLPSGHNCAQCHFQLLKLNKKPAVVVTEAYALSARLAWRWGSLSKLPRVQSFTGVQHISSTNTQRGRQWSNEAQGGPSVSSRVLVYDISIHKYSICRFTVNWTTRQHNSFIILYKVRLHVSTIHVVILRSLVSFKS